MNALFWLLVAVVVLVSAMFWANWTASRLDRLHHLVETARAALDAQLVRRSAVAIEVASSGLLDPASSVLLADAAHQARAAPEDDRELAESALSAALRAVLGDPELRAGVAADGPAGRELLDELDTASRRVLMARTFHNDAVTAALRVRRKRPVRWLRLAGNAATPEFFEIDDAPPPTDPAPTSLS
ncbi:MAG: hypothetical protein J2P24_21210 [Streptosporangiales bacterium]|nr:hypothetical protein [Streptosporangiales bacterium]MBO0891826.1 hypothetical protein [Acidothermales bacterium]